MTLFRRTPQSSLGRPDRTTRQAKRRAAADEDQQRNAERFGTPLCGRQRRRGWW